MKLILIEGDFSTDDQRVNTREFLKAIFLEWAHSDDTIERFSYDRCVEPYQAKQLIELGRSMSSEDDKGNENDR